MPIKVYPRGPFFSIESYNYPGMFVRHAFGKGEISKIEIGDSLDAKDATFVLVTGLADVTCVAFGTFNPDTPGFLSAVAAQDNRQMILDNPTLTWENPEDHKPWKIWSAPEYATFRIVPGLANPSAVSFELRCKPGNYIRHRDGHLWVEPSTINPTTFNQDATFRIVAPRAGPFIDAGPT